MNTHADKTQEHKSISVSRSESQDQSRSGSTFQFIDNRPEAVTQRKLQEMANNSPQAENANSQPQQSIQKKENNTGLPDNLKSGIEHLSGYSMDDVNVHYNSDKPAQLQAHAYAQGSDIHLASRQEEHLPHEAWHVVQQKQGRVQPTLQMKGKVNVNDDAGLEKEADVMGLKASMLKPKENKLIRDGFPKQPHWQHDKTTYLTQSKKIVQRVISKDEWARLDKSLKGTKKGVAVVIDGNGVEKGIRFLSPNYEEQAWPIKTSVWATITANVLQTNYTWPKEKIAYAYGKDIKEKVKGADTPFKSQGQGFDVEGYTDDTSLVHVTTDTATKEKHMTVENAHLLFMKVLEGDLEISYLKKAEKPKNQINDELKARGTAEVDNLNFYPSVAKDSHLDLSLEQYLVVVRNAVDCIAKVPPAYGVEIIRAANTLAIANKIQTKDLYLPSGKGMEEQLFRAVDIMDEMKLIKLPHPIKTACTGIGRDPSSLTDTLNVKHEKGTEGWTGTLQNLVKNYLDLLLTYLNSLT